MNILEKIKKINEHILSEKLFDVSVHSIPGRSLMLLGAHSFSHGHSIEIIFEDVFHLNINTEWHIEHNKEFMQFVEGEEAKQINIKYQVEIGNFVFKLNAEDFDFPFYVVAKELHFNTDKVYYFNKENLGIGERIAERVKL